jgi:hypothetical protein
MNKESVDLSGVTDQLSDWWSAVPAEVKSNLIRGGVGSGGGALLGGLLGGKAETGISPALLGALLGGGAAVAAPYGARMLSGDIRFGPRPRKSVVDYGSDAIIGGAARRPFAVGGAVAGLAGVDKNFPTKNRMLAKIDNLKNISNEAADILRNTVSTTNAEYKPFAGTAGAIKSRQAGTAAKTLAVELKQYLRGKNLPTGLGEARSALRFRSPGAVLGAAAVAPMLGMLIDRYAFGRND